MYEKIRKLIGKIFDFIESSSVYRFSIKIYLFYVRRRFEWKKMTACFGRRSEEKQFQEAGGGDSSNLFERKKKIGETTRGTDGSRFGCTDCARS